MPVTKVAAVESASARYGSAKAAFPSTAPMNQWKSSDTPVAVGAQEEMWKMSPLSFRRTVAMSCI